MMVDQTNINSVVSYEPNFLPYVEWTDHFSEKFAGFSSRLHWDITTGYAKFLPSPTADILDAYYNGTFTRSDEEPMPESEFTPEIIQVCKGVDSYIRWVSNIRSVTYSLHDIGCGFGAGVWGFRQIGIQATGNEANEKWASAANPHCGNSIYTGSFKDVLKNLNYKVDVFFSTHVLEHLVDPLEVLKDVASAISERGVVYLCVPNGWSEDVIVNGRRAGGDFSFPMHLNYFTPYSMIEMLKQAGLEAIQIETRPLNGSPFGDPACPEYKNKLLKDLVGGELFVLATSPKNTTAIRNPDLEVLVKQAYKKFMTSWLSLRCVKFSPLSASLPTANHEMPAVYLEAGWKLPEGDFVWSVDHHSVFWLALPASTQSGDCWELALRMQPLTKKGELDAQSVQVRVNGRALVMWEVQNDEWQRVIVPPCLPDAVVMRVELAIETATSLAALGINSDPTVLGVQLIDCNLRQIAAVKLNSPLIFSQTSDCAAYLVSGWKAPEDGFVWSLGRESNLWLPLAQMSEAKQTIELSLWLTPLTLPGKLDSQTVLLYVAENHLITWEIHASGWYAVEISLKLLDNSGLRLRLEIPHASSLAELGVNTNPTVLGVQLGQLIIK